MESLLSGIIDCVARPSTTDTPVRVIRKSASDSPTCVSTAPTLSMSGSYPIGYFDGGCGGVIGVDGGFYGGEDEVKQQYTEEKKSSDESSSSSIASPPETIRCASNASLSRMLNGGSGDPLKTVDEEGGSTIAASTSTFPPLNSVLTAEGIITGFDACGVDCTNATSCYNNVLGGLTTTTRCTRSIDNDTDNNDDDVIMPSEPPIDANVIRQFEAAFATFLYRNPAFANMSYMTLQKLRKQLLKESVHNMKVEMELRQELAEVREAKRTREMELQRELLIVTRAKSARESELLIQIEKKRRASTLLNCKKTAINGGSVGGGNTSYVSGGGSVSSSGSSTTPILNSSEQDILPTGGSLSQQSDLVEVQREIQRNKIEQAHVLAEIETLKLQIASTSPVSTPFSQEERNSSIQYSLSL